MTKFPNEKLPALIDSFHVSSCGDYFAEYDGWHFEGASAKAVVNKILRYIFNGGEE